MIADGLTQAAIAGLLAAEIDPRISAKLIYKVCRRHGIQCQRTGPRSGEGHPEWKGGRIVNKNGYIEIYSPGHPDGRKHSHYVLEHRLVMERVIGRRLGRHEVVHHMNGDKQDNRPENLELFATNAKHLQETLKGNCPNWTDDAKRRIAAGVAKAAVINRGNRYSANRRKSALCESLSNQTTPRNQG